MTLSKPKSLKRTLPALPPPEPKRTRKAIAADCAELASLLLSHARHLDSSNAHLSPEALLRTAYPDRLSQLLSNINSFVTPSALDHDPTFSRIQFDDSDDAHSDAVVPSVPTIVPQHPRRQLRVIPDHQVPVVPEPPSEPTPPAKQVTAYKAETEIAISRIFQLGNTAAVADPTIPAHTPYDGPSLLTMTAFGELGRFGNQMLQYMFLRAYAKRHGISHIQTPPWVGASLFGLNDATVQRALPPVVEYRNTLANSTFTTDLIDYVKRANPRFNVNELVPDSLDMGIVPDHQRVKNVDVWGWFQWHTSCYAPYKQLIHSIFTPVPELKSHMENVFDRELRFRGGVRRTVVGLHLRFGDYKNIAASSFGYCAPTSWYLNWLQKIWPTLDNPLLFVASDDINAVLRDFAEYNPLTADTVGMGMPDHMKTLKAGFFPDWFGLTQCDVLAISNSTFSFSACMMNRQPNARFFRAHYRGVMEPIDPWNADPIVHRDTNKAGLLAALETLQVVYNTQGTRGVAKNLLYELPYYGLRSAIMKAVLWKQARSKLSTVSA